MRRGIAIGTILVHAALLVLSARAALELRSDSGATIFLSEQDPARRSYEEFTRYFGPDTFLLVTCRGDGSPEFRARVAALAVALVQTPGVASADAPDPASPLARDLGFVNEEGRRLSIPVALRTPGRDSVEAVERTLASFGEVDAALAGQPLLNLALQRASDTVGQRLFPILAAAMALLILIAYRSLRVTLAVLLTTAAALVHGVALLAASGRPMNLITILLPVLLLALTVSLCVHLMNAYRLARSSGDAPPDAIRAMVRREWRPCGVTALTTAAGFGSFALSRIDPLRVLGISMALAILLAFVVALTLLPALLALLRPSPREGLAIGEGLMRIVPRLVARRTPVLALFALLILAGVAALPSIPRETNALHYLPTTHPLRVETERLTREGVGTASVELLFRPAEGAPLTSLAPALQFLERGLGGLGAGVHGLLSPLSLAREGARRLGMTAEAAAEHLAFAPMTGPSEERLAPFRNIAQGVARASLRIETLDVSAYEEMVPRIETLVKGALDAAPGSRCTLTGEFPIVMAVQEDLLRTLLASLAGSALTIFALLAIFARSLRLAFLTMLPSAAPLACVLVACAALGIPLSIATVMVLAVTLGIVTDDSVHLLHVFRGGAPLGEALHHVGTAVTETSIAIFLGFLVLAWAEFAPTRDFGLLTAGAMVAALLADLVLFPVLLRGVITRQES